LLIAGLVIVPGFFRNVKVEPFVASARVTSQKGVLHTDASATGKTVATVDRGTLVHVLELPKSLNSGFTKIQARDGDSYTQAGFIQSADLIEWDSKDSKVALALARMSGPMENGTDAEMRAQIDRLNSVAATFPGKPEAMLAGLDAAKLQFALANKSKDTNPTGTEWQSMLADLATRLEVLRSDPAVQSDADALLKQVHDLLATAPPLPPGSHQTPGTVPPVGQTPPGGQNATPVAPPTPDEIRGLLQAAERLRKAYRYNDAKALVQRVLKADPSNAEAKNLLNKINAAIELERSAQ
jgi:hypothetical protein